MLADDFEELLEQGTLWTLSIEVWAELLNQTELAVSDEGTVLDAVLTLASAEHTEPAERPRVLGALLPCVRMPQLSGSDNKDQTNRFRFISYGDKSMQFECRR